MWMGGDVQMAGKTFLLTKSRFATLHDRLLCTGVYGNSLSIGVNALMSESDNSGMFIIPNNPTLYMRVKDSKKVCYEPVPLGLLRKAADVASLYHERYGAQLIGQAAAIDAISSGSYFCKRDTSYVNSRLAKIDMKTANSIWLKYDYKESDQKVSVVFGLMDDDSYGPFISYVALSVEFFRTGFTTELCPLVTTEGYVPVATQFLNIALTQYQRDRTSSADVFYQNMTSKLVKFKANQVESGEDPRFLEQMDVDTIKAWVEGHEEIKTFGPYVHSWTEWLSRGSQMDVDQFSSKASMTEAVGISSEGFGPITVARSPLSFQLDCSGTLLLDSLLSFVYTPSRSSLPGGLNSDAMTAFSASTYKPIIAVYGKLGEKDPLRGYDMQVLLSGEMFVAKPDGIHFDHNIYLTSRLDGRDVFYRLPRNDGRDDPGQRWLFKSTNIVRFDVDKRGCVYLTDRPRAPKDELDMYIERYPVAS